MSKLFILATDYTRKLSGVLTKLDIMRKAFPNSDIVYGYNPSANDGNIDTVKESCRMSGINYNNDVVIPSALTAYKGQIQTGYLYYFDIMEKFLQTDSDYLIFMESDYYPIKKDVEQFFVTECDKIPGWDMAAFVHPQDINGLLQYNQPMIDLWKKWMGRDDGWIQVYGYCVALSRRGVQYIIDEIHTDYCTQFLSLMNQIPTAPVSLWLIETLFPCIMQKHGANIVPYPSYAFTVFDHATFETLFNDPAMYFIHGVRDDHKMPYFGCSDDLNKIYEYWAG